MTFPGIAWNTVVYWQGVTSKPAVIISGYFGVLGNVRWNGWAAGGWEIARNRPADSALRAKPEKSGTFPRVTAGAKKVDIPVVVGTAS